MERLRMVREQLESPVARHHECPGSGGDAPRAAPRVRARRTRAVMPTKIVRLPIGSGQTISQPYIVAFMTQQLEPEPTDRVLEIGTGSGYQAAVLSGLVAEVYSIEIVEALAEPGGGRSRPAGLHQCARPGGGRLPGLAWRKPRSTRSS